MCISRYSDKHHELALISLVIIATEKDGTFKELYQLFIYSFKVSAYLVHIIKIIMFYKSLYLIAPQ